MKIEEALSKYLLKKRTLTLQSIGTFYINKEFQIVEEANTPFPEDAITFEYDLKAKEDDELVDFIVEHTKKIKPLASADLDSYLTLGKQFLNIGKPFVIEGVGTLEKTPDGIKFKAGQFITPKIEAPKALKENEAEISSGLFGHSERTPPPNYDKRILITISLIIVTIIIAWLIYYYAVKPRKNKELVTSTVTDTIPARKDSLLNILPKADSAKAALNDTTSFYIVIEDSLSLKHALFNQKKLIAHGHAALVYTNDSVTYKLGELYIRPLKDTTTLKDSLGSYYHHMRIDKH